MPTTHPLMDHALTGRRYAEDRGYKFKAGIIEINTGKEILFETEKEIFTFLGLRYVPPHLRNADG
jgi:DNA polymerase mu